MPKTTALRRFVVGKPGGSARVWECGGRWRQALRQWERE